MAEDLSASESKFTRRRPRVFVALLVGVVLGIAGTMLLPGLLHPYLPEVVRRTAVIQGKVLGKQAEPDRLLLKVSSDEGLILASFTQKLEEIALLIEKGDEVTLRVDRYEPFVYDPPIERVQRQEVSEVQQMSEKEAYLQKMEAQLKEWDADIVELEAKAEKAEAQAKFEYYEHLEQLRNKRETVREKLESLKQASNAAWEDLKAGLDLVWQDLKTAMESAASRFKESGSR